MDFVNQMSDYLLFSGLKACIDYTKLYTPCTGDAERCRDHRRIFKNLQHSNINLMRLVKERRDYVSPIQVDVGCLSNNSLEGAQGLS
jgi:hypothetical protein